MKNKLLAKVMGNEIASSIVRTVSRFCMTNRTALLTTGTIGFSWAATGIALKNAGEIQKAIADCRVALATCNTKEERDKVYSLFFKTITPLVAPIILFEGAATACAIMSKRHTDNVEMRLAETAGALSIAQSAIAQYQTFAKEAETALGPEKVHDIQKEIAENTVYEASRCPVNSKQTDEDQLFFEPITGQLIWSTPDRINLAWVSYKSALISSTSRFVPFSEVFFPKIGADYRVAAAEVFGYFNEDASKMDDHLCFEGTRVVVNGKEMSALMINYYPTVNFNGDTCDMF